ncbi:flavin reductase [Hominifimenecus sp. rT4P-3]|uniref:flavin reductase n=1 Tax=Hominifimenecus sp. rT4P-3 TaxID=3242979 RepID=UPI003DA621D4
MDQKTFFHMSYGVYLVTAMDGERPTGCIANSIMQITSSPATVAVSMNHDNYTNSCIAKTGKFAFSILSEKTDPALIGLFGFHSGKDIDKFAGKDYQMVEGVPVLKEGCGYVVCRVIDKMETATHTVFLGQVEEAERLPGDAPAMSYAYYHNVVKGKSPKNAPTYVEESAAEPQKETAEAETKSEKWVCQVCGYVHEGKLPDGFQCPICGVGTDRFEKQEE